MAEAAVPPQVPKLKILVCGRTGVGKSSLCNSLIGKDLCKVNHPGESTDGIGLKACTEKTEKLTVHLRGIEIHIFDSPGLQDGDVKNDKKYVEDMYKKCKDVDLVLYCIDMTMPRFTPAEERAIGIITKQFGPEIWKRCVFVLTKANVVPIPRSKRGTMIQYHTNIFKSYQKIIRSLLRETGVPEDICDTLQMVAAGNFDPLETNDSIDSDRMILFASEHCKADPGPPIQRVNFIPELLVACLSTVPRDSCLLYVQATGLIDRTSNLPRDMRNALEAAAQNLMGNLLDSETIYDPNPPARFELNRNQLDRVKEYLPVILGLGGAAIGLVNPGMPTAAARFAGMAGFALVSNYVYENADYIIEVAADIAGRFRNAVDRVVNGPH